MYVSAHKSFKTSSRKNCTSDERREKLKEVSQNQLPSPFLPSEFPNII
jgi:hypothetical protein